MTPTTTEYRSLLAQALDTLRDAREAYGGCDHAVNICVCGLDALIRDINDALTPRVTFDEFCAWTRRVDNLDDACAVFGFEVGHDDVGLIALDGLYAERHHSPTLKRYVWHVPYENDTFICDDAITARRALYAIADRLGYLRAAESLRVWDCDDRAWFDDDAEAAR